MFWPNPSKPSPALLIDRCRVMVDSRADAKPTEHEFVQEIPVFLDQPIETLKVEESSKHLHYSPEVRNARGVGASDVGTTAPCTGGICSLIGSRLNKLFGSTMRSDKPSQILPLNPEHRFQSKNFAPLVSVMIVQLLLRLASTQLILLRQMTSASGPRFWGTRRHLRSCESIWSRRSSP